MLVGAGGGVDVGVLDGGGVEPELPLKVAFTVRSPVMVTKVDLVELSSVPVHDSQA